MSNVKKVLYFFSGRVFPERADVNIPPLKFKFDIKEAGITGTAITSIQASQVMVQFITKNKIENIYTLKNYVEDCIRLQVDVLGYLQACSYDLSLIHI